MRGSPIVRNTVVYVQCSLTEFLVSILMFSVSYLSKSVRFNAYCHTVGLTLALSLNGIITNFMKITVGRCSYALSLQRGWYTMLCL